MNEPSDVFQFIDMKEGDREQCWPWNRVSRGGGKDSRPYFSIDGKKQMVYRIVYELVHGVKLKSEEFVRHTCDNGAAPVRCCNPYHLVLGTQTENMRDMTERARHGLPHHTVRLIRKLYADGRTQTEIAKLTGLSRQNIGAIVRHETYRSVEEEEEEESHAD